MSTSQQHYLKLLNIPVWHIRQNLPAETDLSMPQVLSTAESMTGSAVPSSVEEVVSIADLVTKDQPKALATVGSRQYECSLCKLHVGCSQMIKGRGSEKARLFVITEAPTFNEDLAGKPLAEDAMMLFTAMISAVGYSLDDIYVTPYIKCSPYQEFITAKEEALCYQHLKAELETIQPQQILLLGRNVAKSLLKSQQSFDELRTQPSIFTELGYDVPVYVSYNPYQLMKFPEEKRRAWKDFKRLKLN